MKHLKFDNEKVALGFDTHPLPMIGRTVREGRSQKNSFFKCRIFSR